MIRIGWDRVRAWLASLKPGSGEEILSWDFGTLSEEPGVDYNHRRFAPSEEAQRLSIAAALDSSERDVLDVAQEELREETKPVLEIFHLSQTVPTDEGPVEVLRGFSLQVKRGEIVSILDSNSDLQSLLLSLIGGLSQPTRGAVYLDGQEVWQLPAWKRSRLRREKISFLFREPRLLPHLSLLENVLMPLEHARPSTLLRVNSVEGAAYPGGKSAVAPGRYWSGWGWRGDSTVGPVS